MTARLRVLHDRPGDVEPIYLSSLANLVPIECLRWGEEPRLDDRPDLPLLVDFEGLGDAKATWLRSAGLGGQGAHRLFVVSARDRAEVVRARALGATGIVPRPVDPRLLCHLLGFAPTERRDVSDAGRRTFDEGDDTRIQRAALASIRRAAEAIDEVFGSCAAGRVPTRRALIETAQSAMPSIVGVGLDGWLDLVRRHHTGTYQHSLITMGVAAVFAGALGFDEAERTSAAVAGLVHDLGKVWVPEHILCKPGPLTPEEFEVVRRHSRDGWQALRPADPSLETSVLDAVLHHHEFLDGSGYPDGLTAERIPTLTRMITIADICAALAETRSYRAALKPFAIRMILDTHAARGRIDRRLWAAFPLAEMG